MLLGVSARAAARNRTRRLRHVAPNTRRRVKDRTMRAPVGIPRRLPRGGGATTAAWRRGGAGHRRRIVRRRQERFVGEVFPVFPDADLGVCRTGGALPPSPTEGESAADRRLRLYHRARARTQRHVRRTRVHIAENNRQAALAAADHAYPPWRCSTAPTRASPRCLSSADNCRGGVPARHDVLEFANALRLDPLALGFLGFAQQR